ncbi:MAG: PIN domain-containing protein [Alphaproteobacteria bacterium]|nr:PIN domain-containing protein [Alphaproteobacteria bacterium]
MRVFLDANVLFSAARNDGAIRRLLGLMRDRGHECWVDAFVVEEARRNLEAKSPGSLPDLHALLRHVRMAPAGRQLSTSTDLAALPEKDRPVLDAAIRAGCDALVTGDRTHFGRFYGDRLGGIAIHSPRTLFDALGS